MINRCTHLKTNGARCTMPAANDKELCFQHEARLMRLRARPCPPSTFATVPLVAFVYPEDHDSILENIHSIARAMASGQIDHRQASVMDRLMNTALKALRQGRQLEKIVTSAEMVRHFRLDKDGNPRALPEPLEPPSEVSSSPASSSNASPIPDATQAANDLGPDLSAVIPTIAAAADPEYSQNPDAQPLENHLLIFPPVPSAYPLTPLVSTPTGSWNIKRLFSNTYVLSAGKLKKALHQPHRIHQSEEKVRMLGVYLNLAR